MQKEIKLILTIDIQKYSLLERGHEPRVGRHAFVRGVEVLPLQLGHGQLAHDYRVAGLADLTGHLFVVRVPGYRRRRRAYAEKRYYYTRERATRWFLRGSNEGLGIRRRVSFYTPSVSGYRFSLSVRG